MAWCGENLQDCQAWRDASLPLSTTSSEATRMFDALLRQYVCWIENDQLGGFERCAERMMQADPDFVMGKVMNYGLELIGTGRTTRLDRQFAANIDSMVADSVNANITERERLHVKAIKQFADGFSREACETWETILSEHPTDLLALKLAHDTYFYLGDSAQIRDSVARVLPKWKAHMPLYSYLKGMISFGYEECQQYALAEESAKEALSLQKEDCWATHALAHVFEMNGRFKEGIRFLSGTVNDWEPCAMLACHNHWHWALYHIEQGDHGVAEGIFERQIAKRVQSGALLDIVDACSLLYRLKLEGRDVVTEKWDPVYEICRSHVDDHILSFNDTMMCMAAVGTSDTDAKTQLLDSMRQYVKSSRGTNVALTADYGIPICDAMCHFESGDFPAAAALVLPIRREIQKIGGSNAQRDVFDQFAVHACLKSGQPDLLKEAKHILLEKEKSKPNSLLYKRLGCHLEQIHGQN